MSTPAPQEGSLARVGGDPAPVTALSAPPEQTPPPLPRQEWQLEFTGNHREYFRIWIVNTFLTLISIGVYAAWAKVRKKQYLYGHTKLGGHAFDFTAKPSRLLAGNLIVFVLFLGYAFFGAAYPLVKLLTIVLAAPILPWLVIRALSFNARNSVHRGLPLRYRPSYSLAFITYVLLPVGTVLTAGILYPYFSYQRKKLAIDRLRFGDSAFHFEGGVKAFYGLYLRAVLPFLLWFVGGSILIGAWSAATNKTSNITEQWFYLLSLSSVGAFALSRMIARVLKFNCVWNHTSLDGHRFHADMKLGKYLRLQLGNAAAIIASLGLALPWASMRTLRYTLACLTVIPDGSLEKVENLGSSSGAAVGDAATDFLGFDIGL